MHDVRGDAAHRFREGIASPDLCALYDHWLARARAAGDVPGRRDVDPLAFHRLLPYIWLIDYERAADVFRYRLAGDWIESAFGRSLKGRVLSEVVPREVYAGAETRVRALLAEPSAMLVTGTLYHFDDGTSYHGQRLILPLRSDRAAGEQAPLSPADGLVGASLPEQTRIRDTADAENRFDTAPVSALLA